jgi:tetratricopeptide (TPR) repeat protein
VRSRIDSEVATAGFQARSAAGWALLLLAVFLTALVFLANLRFEFVYDDLPQIVRNPNVQSWQHAPAYFTRQVWANLYGDQAGDYYRPLFLLWLRLNHAWFGLRPGGWHATALLLHLLCTVLVYLLGYRLTKDAICGAMAALFFGLHPIHIEAVAWVSGVTEPLMAAPLLASFLCYRQRETALGSGRWQAASLGLFVVAVLAKETALLLPLIIAANEWLFPVQAVRSSASTATRNFRHMARVLGPYLLLAAAYMAARVHALKGFGRPSEQSLASVLLTWPSLLWFYSRQVLWPFNISAFYETPWIKSARWQGFFLPLMAVAAVAAGLWLWARRSRVAAFGAIWLVVTMLPPLWGVRYFERGELAHDRYLYVPSIALALLLAMAVRKLGAGQSGPFGLPVSQSVAVLALACLLGAATITQSVFWTNNLVLYSRGVQTAPHSALAWDHLGTEWMARKRPDKAIKIYQHALALAPDDWDTNFALGIAYSTVGSLPEADRYLARACQLRSAYANQYYYLGLVRMQMGKLKEAEIPLRRALEIWPAAVGWHQTLGVVLERQGDLAGARDQFQAELVDNPASDAKRQLEEVQARLRAASSPARSRAAPEQRR